MTLCPRRGSLPGCCLRVVRAAPCPPLAGAYASAFADRQPGSATSASPANAIVSSAAWRTTSLDPAHDCPPQTITQRKATPAESCSHGECARGARRWRCGPRARASAQVESRRAPSARQFRGARLPPHDRSQLAGQPGSLARKPVAACGIHAKAAHSEGQSMSPSARARVTASARL